MKKFIENDQGIAYGIYAIGLFLVLGGAFFILLNPLFNRFFDIFNELIGQGMVSTTTSDAMSFIRNVLVAFVVFMLLGLMAWAYVRALEKRRYEG